MCRHVAVLRVVEGLYGSLTNGVLKLTPEIHGCLTNGILKFIKVLQMVSCNSWQSDKWFLEIHGSLTNGVLQFMAV